MIEMYHLEEGEKVLRIVRRHWFVMLTELLGVAIAVVLPGIILFLLEMFIPTQQIVDTFSNQLVLFGYSLWVLLISIQLAFAWTNYYFDMWVITSKRIIHVDQKAMFSRVLSSFRLERVQDITVDVHGFFHTILNFGDIQVQTAGAERKFILRTTAHPNELRDYILDLQQKGELRD